MWVVQPSMSPAPPRSSWQPRMAPPRQCSRCWQLALTSTTRRLMVPGRCTSHPSMDTSAPSSCCCKPGGASIRRWCDGSSSVAVAAMHGREDTLEVLLEARASVNLVMDHGETALHSAAAQPTHTRILKRLLAARAELMARPSDGVNAFAPRSAREPCRGGAGADCSPCGGGCHLQRRDSTARGAEQQPYRPNSGLGVHAYRKPKDPEPSGCATSCEYS